MKKLVGVVIFLIFIGFAGINDVCAGGKIQNTKKEKVDELNTLQELKSLSLDKMALTLLYIKYNYYKEVDMDKCLEQIFKDGISGCTDRYSRFINKAEAEEEDASFGGAYESIGIKFDVIRGTPTIVYVYPNSPAGYLEIMAGDIITAISPTELETDSVSVSGFDREMISFLLDGKKSKKIIIYIERNGRLMVFPIRKGIVKEDSIFFARIENNIGYMKIARFTHATAKDFELVVSSLSQNGAKALIIDLRNNPGGFLNSVIRIIGFFQANTDPVIYTHNWKSDYVPVFSEPDKRGIFKDQKVVVLVNEESASAAEILSGWLKEEKGVPIIGKATHGKDLMQKPFDLPDGSKLYLTIDQYFIGRKKISIGKVGVEPTIKVNFFSGKPNDGADYQAKKAIEVATEMIGSF